MKQQQGRSRRALWLGLLAAQFAVAFALVHLAARAACPSWRLPAAAAEDAPRDFRVYARKATVDRAEAGEVLVNRHVALRLRTRAGGSTPYERAEIVAMRLNSLLMDGANPADIRADRESGYAGVFWGDTMLIMVDREHAELNRTTPLALASVWADELRSAFGVHDTVQTEATVPVKEETTQASAKPDEHSESKGVEWKPEEAYDDKIVPVISAGRGIRAGAARVNGPRSKVKQVQAVAQIEADFKDFLEIEIYVPISTEKLGEDLGRVQGVGVTGLGDYRF